MLLTLAWQLTPGATELAEQLWHVAATGHGAHAKADADHQPQGSEHRCTGVFHLCGCHATRPFDPPSRLAVAPRPPGRLASLASALDRPLDGVASPIEHPPRA